LTLVKHISICQKPLP